MYKTVITTIVLALLAITATAQDPETNPLVAEGTTLTWDDPNPPGTVNEYRIYCTTSSGPKVDPLNLKGTITYPGTTWAITMPDGHWYCSATCYAIGIESGESNELEFTVFGSPVNFRIQ